MDRLPLAFGFGNLAMLGWLAVAAAPLVIHFWMRHTRRELPWAAIQLLQQAIKRIERRMRLQQWLLLAVRTLILLLLALAAAKPHLESWQAFAASPQVHRVIVLDTSFSMGLQSDGETLLARAQRMAHQLLADARAGEVYSVVTMAEPPQALLTGLATNATQAAQQVDLAKLTYGSADLPATIALLEQIITQAEQQQQQLAQQEILFFTDLAGPTWQSVVATSTAASFVEKSENNTPAKNGPSLFSNLARRAKLQIVDLHAAEHQNLAVSKISLARRFPTTAEPVPIACDITNYSEQTVDPIVVQLLVDEQLRSQQTIRLPPRGTITLSFEATFQQPGWHTVSVRLPSDRLPADDQRWLAVDVRHHLRVLCVEGERHAGRYLLHALQSDQDQAALFATNTITEGELLETTLDDFDCILLANVARFTEQEAHLLQHYVAQGGGAIFFLGDRTLPDAYNQVFASPFAAPPSHSESGKDQRSFLLPVTIGQLAVNEQLRLDPRDYQHPVTAPFRGHEVAGLLSTPVMHYFRLTPHKETGVEIALALPNGDPLLVTAPCDKGRVAIVATAASLETVDPASGEPWNYLPAWPSFLPLVRELVTFSATSQPQDSETLVGQPISGPLPSGWSDNEISVLRPDGQEDHLPLQNRSSSRWWAYPSTDRPGIYRVQEQDGQQPLSQIAVNVPPSESDVARIAPSMLPRSLVRQPATTTTNEPVTLPASNLWLHRRLLYVVLGLLLAESVLAYRMGRQA